MQNYYAILDVADDADDAAIHAAYRSRAQEYHPDKVRHLAGEFQELAETRMRDINTAYGMLSDPDKRLAYDAERAQATVSDATELASVPPRATDRATASRAAAIVISAVLLAGLLTAGGVQWRSWHHRNVAAEYASAAANFQLARDHADNQRWEEALLALHSVTRARPDRLDAWNLRWRAELTLGLNRDAAQSLERAIEIDPGALALRVEHTRVRFRLGDLVAVRAELAWLRWNGEIELATDLLRQFREQNLVRARRLSELDAP